MFGRILDRVLSTRPTLAPLILRLAAGVLFVSYSLGKFRRHDSEANAFDRYGIPFPDVTVYLIGTLEFVGGLLLIVGLLTRPIAVALIGNMIGALSTAGRIEPNFNHVGLPIVLVIILVVLVWTGAGRFSVDRVVQGSFARTTSEPTG